MWSLRCVFAVISHDVGIVHGDHARAGKNPRCCRRSHTFIPCDSREQNIVTFDPAASSDERFVQPKKGSLATSFQAAIDEAKALLAPPPPPPVKKSSSKSSAKSEASSTRSSAVKAVKAEADGASLAPMSQEEAELLAKLGAMLEGVGGSAQMLEGWRASAHRRSQVATGKTGPLHRDVLYVAPDGTQHRSNVSVTRHFGLAGEPQREKSGRAAAQVADTAWNAQKWDRVRIKYGALTTCGVKSDEERAAEARARAAAAAAANAADPRRITYGNSGGNRGRLSGGTSKQRKGARHASNAADRPSLNNTDALAIEEHGFAECRGLISPELCEKLSKEPMVRAPVPCAAAVCRRRAALQQFASS